MIRQLQLFVLLVIGITSAVADAQQERGRRGRSGFGQSGVLYYLMAVPEIREHLAITDKQEKLFGGLILDRNAQWSAMFRGPGGADRNQNRARLRKLTRQFEDLLQVLLEPEQTARLNEIRLQYDGVQALDRPDFVKSLGLSDEQLQRIKEIRGRQTRRQVRPEQEAKILEVLTDGQRQNWNRMKGEVFVFPAEMLENERRSFRPQRP